MHFICQRLDIPAGESKGFVVDGRTLFGVHHEGQYYFYWNRCPHLGVEMDDMEDRFLDDSSAIIKCSVHGARFETESGHCFSGPCEGKRLEPVTIVEEGNLFYLAG